MEPRLGKCSSKLALKRADIVTAMTSPEAVFKPAKQSFTCQLANGEYTAGASLSPELTFKNGAVTAGSVHVDVSRVRR